jgi:hypothetical protein
LKTKKLLKKKAILKLTPFDEPIFSCHHPVVDSAGVAAAGKE